MGRPRWLEPPLPEDPREQRKIRTKLIILALVGVVAELISRLAR